ncbi:MAG: GNAT family N-acetyltransferase [Chloroflexi bacterium]|nr:GNAT family N-acetyltransferase [Chloroflexota bacterium]
MVPHAGDFTFVPASHYSLYDLAATVTSAFQGYAYSVIETAPRLARLIRVHQIDLDLSHVVRDRSGRRVGISFVGLRQRHAWISAFGIAPPYRGIGLAQRLLSKLLERISQVGCNDVRLEVLVENLAAYHIYAKAGFLVTNELVSFERSSWEPAPSLPAHYEWHVTSPERAWGATSSVLGEGSCWQREAPAVLSASETGLVISDKRNAVVGVTFQVPGDNFLSLNHAAAVDHYAEDVLAIAIRHLCTPLGQWSGRHITLLNEDAGSSIARACHTLGFRPSLRQYEMHLALSKA